MPYVIVVIDELSDLVMTHGEVQEAIIRLGQKGRAAGIHMIIATQRPDGRIIDANIKAQLTTKIAFRCGSNYDYKTIFGRFPPYRLLGNGDGCAVLTGHTKEWQRFQSPVVTLDDKEFEEILQAYQDQKRNTSSIKQIPRYERKNEKDQLREIIQKTGETRIRQLREQMGIRNNTLIALMEELKEEGFLEKKGKQYVKKEQE